jgi:hypothetical protein
LLGGAWINRWLEPVGHESFETAAESPFIQNRWRAQKEMNKGLMIALEKNSFFGSLASKQKIQHFSRGRSPVDVVANKNHDRATGWVQGTIHVDLAEQGCQKIGAAYRTSVLSHWATQAAGTRVALTLVDGSTRELILADYF